MIPAGEGYSILWEQGKDKIVAPWHEAACSCARNWFINMSTSAPTRRAIWRPIAAPVPRPREKFENREKDMIEYIDERSVIRQNLKASSASADTR